MPPNYLHSGTSAIKEELNIRVFYSVYDDSGINKWLL